MVSALPSRIIKYKISATSPTDELITLGQIFAEIGDYAASFLDREHLTVAKMCASRLKKVVPELISRGVITSIDGLYEMDESKIESAEISLMTIEDLYRLYRQWPVRHKADIMDFQFEAAIVRELKTRKASNKNEQFKIDYCTLTYSNECESSAFTFIS